MSIAEHVRHLKVVSVLLYSLEVNPSFPIKILTFLAGKMKCAFLAY